MIRLNRPKRWYPLSNLASVCLLLAALVGCQDEPPITQYTIDRRVPPQLSTQQQLLGALVSQGDEVLFYKMVGEQGLVSQVAGEVKDWIKGVRYENGQPDLTAIPEGWSLRMGGVNNFDVAKLDLPVGEPPLELKITRLKKNGTWEEAVLTNVNRWRGQMGLASSDDKFAAGELLLGAEAESTPEPAIWVSLVGEMGTGGMSGGSLTGGGLTGGGMESLGGGLDAASGPPLAVDTGAESAEPRVQYTAPEGWQPGTMSSMRLAAFKVVSGERSAEITVIPATGDLTANVERWIGQVYPEGAPDGELERVMQSEKAVTVDGREGKRFFVRGNGASAQAIDGTVVPHENGGSLFIKMTGDADVVAGESERIGQFLETLKVKS